MTRSRSRSAPRVAFAQRTAYAITFCDRAENHQGMQMIGSSAARGFSYKELRAAVKRFGATATLHDLRKSLPKSRRAEAGAKAYVLVIKGGVNKMLKDTAAADRLMTEIAATAFDTTALMGRGVGRRVKNKHARHNNCIGDVAQAPEIAAGKGTVVPFSSLPWLTRLRAALSCLGPLGTGLVAETNKYFDVAKCGIGWHGDAERRVVVGVRLGASAAMPLKFQWFQQSSPLGDVLSLDLQHGDMYVMSDKAVGHDWMKDRKGLTLRHAAGAEKYAGNKRPRE